MIRPKIGNVYNVDYECLHDVINFEDATVCQISESNQKELVDGIKNSADSIKKYFDDIIQNSKEYRRMLSKFNDGKYSFNNRAEKALFKRTLENMKKELFPKHSETDMKKKANNLFIRFFLPEQMTINNESGLKVLYAGKRLTPKGNVVHKWFVLSPSKIRSHYIDDKMRKHLSIIKETI